jgi:hypothetical protein
MSVFHYNMHDVTCQKFCVTMGPVLTGCGPMDVSCHNFVVYVSVSYVVFKDLNELFGFKNIHKAKEAP